MNLICKARAFAHEAHDSVGQVRKYSGEPYWVHTDEVADIVASVGGTPTQIAIAHLHDVLEDVGAFYSPDDPKWGPEGHPYGFDSIARHFGRPVALGVLHLTDMFTHSIHPHLNRETRRRIESYRLSMIPPDIQTIKVADMISNTKDIVKADPNFAKIYMEEKSRLLPLLKFADPKLLEIANRFLDRYYGREAVQ
jgi:(p)ppGpp synthase/HD superfamily hydrolase